MILMLIHVDTFGIGTGSALARARVYVRRNQEETGTKYPVSWWVRSAHTKIGSASGGGRGGYLIIGRKNLRVYYDETFYG